MSTYDYDAWGNVVNSTGSTPNAYLYRGKRYDADISLAYLRARYFNPVTGRFLSTDPARGIVTNPSTLHRYLYASANPADKIDPSGCATQVEKTTLLASFAFNALLIQQLIQVDKHTNCIWQKEMTGLKLHFSRPY